jgi:predicted RNA-binding protein with PIN domain
LEVAFAVALAGARVHPPVAAPSALRPFLRFQKLPAAALTPLRRVVESDEEFRERVADVANEELVERGPWLWIHRPEGWEDELLTLWDAQQAAEEVGAGERAERSAQKRLDVAERAARRAQADLAAARTELERERAARRDADTARVAGEGRTRQLDVELGGARRRLRAAEEEQTLLRARLAELEAELQRRPEETVAAGALVEPFDEPALEPVPEVEPVPVAAETTVADPVALAAALGDAASATVRLAEALEAARRSLVGPDPAPTDPSAPTDQDSARVPRIGTDSVHTVPNARGRRRAVALPVRLLSDSPEAALHLLRVPNMLVLVDGYNVAKLAWPGAQLPEQRRRLLDLLVELTARHPADVLVVFDGSDVTGSRHGGRHAHVRIVFSPPGVTADDVLVEHVEQAPPDRPVLVVTSDRALGESVRARGANVVLTPQFLATAHRRPGKPSSEPDDTT